MWLDTRPPNGLHRGGRGKCADRAGRPRPGVPRSRSLLGGQQDPVKVDPRRRPRSVAAEYDPGRAQAVLGEVDPEDVRVIPVVGMQPKAPVQRRYRTEGSKHEPAAPDADLGSGAEHGPRLHVGPLGTRPVPTAEVAPDLGVLRAVRADAVTWGADQVAEQPLHLTRQPGGSVPGPVGEGHHADAVVGREEDLGVEPGDHALVLHGGMPAEIDPPEREAHTRYPWIGLVVRLEH